ncbi:hypothetical protein Gohar_028114, partial [Gossypium harknessii]|nr:hypothetical protein [Gossypium harknessii]
MTQKCLKKSMISAIEKKDKLKEVKPVEEKTSMVNSMVLFCKNMDGEEGLMFVDINIEGLKWSALIDTGASDLFISKKAAKKLGLSIRKQNKKIKMVNSKDVPTVGTVRNVELQIGEWKSNEEFENINSIKWNVTKALLKKLVEHETDMRPVKSIVEPPPLGNVGCRKGLFKVLKQGGRGTMGGTKLRCENQVDSNWNKSKFEQVRAEISCQRDVPTSAAVQVKRRQKLRQRFRRKGQPNRKTSREKAKATREFQ